jgi:hypothetical protein
MSWSFTVMGSVQEYRLTEDLIEIFAAVNPVYPSDMQRALSLAQETGLRTAVCTGYRTPNPYGGPEAISITVMGTVEPVDWHALVKGVIFSGPDKGTEGHADVLHETIPG